MYNIKKIRCKSCNSSQTYYRQKTQDYACIKCGFIFKKLQETYNNIEEVKD